jgi:hypothetical protein
MAAERKNRRQYKKKSSEDIKLSASIRPYIKLLHDTTRRDQEKNNQIEK